MESKEKMKMIEQIRSFRVRKKQKKIKMIESAIAETKNKISSVEQKLVQGRQQFQEEKKEILNELMGSKVSVDALYGVQKKELLHDKFVNDTHKESDELKQLGEQKSRDLQASMRDLWASEKALMKIEEFINSDNN